MDADLQAVLNTLVRAPRAVDARIQHRFANVISIKNVNHFEMVNSLMHGTTNLSPRLALQLLRWYSYHDKEHRRVLSFLDEPDSNDSSSSSSDERADAHSGLWL
ncbi:hypothetical protein F4808DRAFT_206417 [Astrocystis sublimbata]|nr:hypothetical protein F4808DRAFT_206417 [Astrocystis sublimbata]